MIHRMAVRVNGGSPAAMDRGGRFEPAFAVPEAISPTVQADLKMRSEIEAISPLVDRLMRLIGIFRCKAGVENDIEIALREALANAVVHGNRQDARKKVHISCAIHASGVLSIVIKDEGCGFDPAKVPDPTAIENIARQSGRGIHLMKAFMDDVRFEQGGTQVRLHKVFKP